MLYIIFFGIIFLLAAIGFGIIIIHKLFRGDGVMQRIRRYVRYKKVLRKRRVVLKGRVHDKKLHELLSTPSQQNPSRQDMEKTLST